MLSVSALNAHAARLGPHLVRQPRSLPAWHAAAYAELVGQSADGGADALVCAPPVLRGLRRLRESLLGAEELLI